MLMSKGWQSFLSNIIVSGFVLAGLLFNILSYYELTAMILLLVPINLYCKNKECYISLWRLCSALLIATRYTLGYVLIKNNINIELPLSINNADYMGVAGLSTLICVHLYQALIILITFYEFRNIYVKCEDFVSIDENRDIKLVKNFVGMTGFTLLIYLILYMWYYGYNTNDTAINIIISIVSHIVMWSSISIIDAAVSKDRKELLTSKFIKEQKDNIMQLYGGDDKSEKLGE